MLLKYVKFYEDLNDDLLVFLKCCFRDGKSMLMSLGYVELVMFCGWLEVLSHTNQNTWDASVVYVQMGFILSAYFSWCFMKNKRLLSPSSTRMPV